jgi:hypothetical protein
VAGSAGGQNGFCAYERRQLFDRGVDREVPLG